MKEQSYNIAKWLDAWFMQNMHVDSELGLYLKSATLLIITVIVCVVAWYVARRVLLGFIDHVAKKTEAKWDDKLVKYGVFKKLAHIIPAIVVNIAAPYIFGGFPALVPIAKVGSDVFIVAIIVWSINAVITALRDILMDVPALKDKPLDSYSQLAKVIIILIGGVLIFSMILGQSPIAFIGAMGAAAAILMLIFKDAILGFVASIQMSAYNMIREGDWVSMPKYDADGDVIAINLTTVMVQNWDKTITTIPAYAFISDSFKNWRGMQESGGRRIKRAINIKMSSVRFCDDEMLARFRQFQLVKDYIEDREREIEQYNTENDIDKTVLINGRHLTNIGVFRIYATHVLQRNKHLNPDMTMMVRQLQPTEKGIPLEIYCFSADKAWVNYEGIIADIFDHLIAAIPAFDLEIFEIPTGRDFKSVFAPNNSPSEVVEMQKE